MPHKVEISDKTYDRLKEYCELNDLKIGQLADKFIYDSLMIELYGDVPFTTYKKPPKEDIVKLVKEAEMNSIPISEATGDTTPVMQVVKDVFKQVENIADEVSKKEQDKENPKQEEILKKAGVPDKVVNKITKRRLK